MLKHGNVPPSSHHHTHCITTENFGNRVFNATVQGTCSTLTVSQLLDVYQHYQINSRPELVILHFNILKCISDRIGAGTRYFRCLFFVQQHSEAAGNKRNHSTLCRVAEVLHGRLKEKRCRKQQGWKRCLFLLQGWCKREKWTFRPDHVTIKTFITGPNSDEAGKKLIINCFYSLCKLVEEMATKPRQSLVYSVSIGLEELFLPVH